MPFTMMLSHSGNRLTPIIRPLPTITTAKGGEQAFVQPFLVPQFGERDGQEPRTHPLPTVDTQNRHGLVAPFMVDVNHGESERSPGGRVHSLDTPMGVLSTKNGKSLVLPFLTEYYGTGEARSADEPLSTVTCRHRHGLAMVQLVETMQQLGIADVGFRMLEPHELAAAQGFPKGYEIYGSKAEQVKQIGNSVHTAVARALCEAIGAAA